MKFFLNIIGVITFLGAALISSEAHFLVTNSNRVNFYVEGEPQDMSSGLFSSYINDGNSDYRRIKAKGGLLIDFDLELNFPVIITILWFTIILIFLSVLYPLYKISKLDIIESIKNRV